MRSIIALLLALAAMPASAHAARPSIVNAPSAVTAGKSFAVQVRAARGAKVSVFLAARRSAKPRGRAVATLVMRKSRAKVRIKAPRSRGSRFLVACVRRRCGKARRISIRMPAAPVMPAVPAAPATPPTPAAPAATPTPEPGPQRPAANPLVLALEADATRRAATTIGKAGGTVSAAGADGTTYVLTVPEGALPEPQLIAMTPLSGAGGLPLADGLRAGVKLEPDGAAFLVPLQLDVKPAKALPAAQALAFGTQGDGGDFHLQRFKAVENGVLRLTLRHFSAAGVGAGTSQEIDAILARPPSGEQALAEQTIAAAEAKLARGDIDQAAFDSARRTALRVWATGLAAHLRKAETDDYFLDESSADFLAFQKEVQESGLGGFESDLDAMRASHKRAITASWDRAYSQCLNHGEYELLGRMLLMQELDQRLGYGLPLPDDRLSACGRFHVDASWDYRMNMTNSGASWWSSFVFDFDWSGTSVEVLATFDPATGLIGGTGPVTTTGFTRTQEVRASDPNTHCDLSLTSSSPSSTAPVTLGVRVPIRFRARSVIGGTPSGDPFVVTADRGAGISGNGTMTSSNARSTASTPPTCSPPYANNYGGDAGQLQDAEIRDGLEGQPAAPHVTRRNVSRTYPQEDRQEEGLDYLAVADSGKTTFTYTAATVYTLTHAPCPPGAPTCP